MASEGKPAMLRWGLLTAACFGASKGFEKLGDLAPYAADGVSGERLGWHLLALVLLVAAIAFGFLFLRAAYRRTVGGAQAGGGASPRDDAGVFTDDGDFDPDAALQRYMAGRAQAPAAPPHRPQAFGKRQV